MVKYKQRKEIGMKRIGIEVTEEKHQEIKLFCVEHNIDMRRFFLNSVEEKMNEKEDPVHGIKKTTQEHKNSK